MKKISKKLVSLILTLILVVSVAVPAFAQDENQEQNTVELTIMSSNVAGLPIPSKFSKNGKVVPDDTKMLAAMINESGCDIVCVQEDFQYHSLFAKEMTNYPYQTYTSGGIPVGDGLNVYSKYPIYNIDRVTWDEACGILDSANDELTPKGFLKFTADINGVLVDIYDIHADANSSEADQHAKAVQYAQLCAYINKNSADMPVLITGDYNCTLHTDYLTNFYETFIVEEGFADAWVTVKNNGDYLRGDNAQQLIDDWYSKFYNCYWGCWDSVERVLYRDNGGAVITPTEFEYETYYEPGTTRSLSDHSMMIAKLSIDCTNYVRPEIELNEPRKVFFLFRFFHAVKMVFRCLGLLVPEFFSKLFAGELTK